MYFEIEYEFNVALVGRDESLGEDYYDTKTYTYDVPKNKIIEGLIHCVKKDYEVGGKDLKSFLENYNLWYELMDDYEDQLYEYLYSACYDDAEKEFIKELRV